MKFSVCIGLITLFLGCAATQNREENTGEYIDDSVITAAVKDAIFDEPTLKVFQISVETYQGIVALSGSVDSQKAVDKVGEIVRKIEGVKSIKNDLIVQ
jgi:osmotically-inducible protein OsmY